jgi:hypothetical protein
LTKALQEKPVVIIAEKDLSAIVAVLNDVRKGGNCDARRSPYNTVVIQIEI